MAKKIKPNSAAFNVESTTPEIQKIDNTLNVQDEAIEAAIGNSLLGERISPEQKEKLDLFDGIKNENLKLVKEKDDLETRISEYICELNSLRSEISSVNELKKSNEQLSSELESLKNKYSDVNIEKLKKINSELQESNDNNLMKIAELSFENAKMTSEIQELTLKLNSNELGRNENEFAPEFNKPIVTHERIARPNVNPYNPYSNNGYGTWH